MDFILQKLHIFGLIIFFRNYIRKNKLLNISWQYDFRHLKILQQSFFEEVSIFFIDKSIWEDPQIFVNK